MSPKPQAPSRLFAISLCFLGLEGLGCLVYLFSIPTDPRNAIAFGFSAARLGIAAVLLTGVLASLIAAARVRLKGMLFQAANSLLTAKWSFPLLLAGSLAGMAICVNWPFADPALQASLQRAFPLMLFATLAGLHALALQLSLPGKERLRRLALVGMTVILLLSYVSITSHYAQVNRKYRLSDQEAMLNTLRQIKATDYSYTGSRDFMPGFPLLASPFMDTSLPSTQLFAQGKLVNVAFSLVFLAVIFLLMRRYFDIWISSFFGFLAAFTLFIYKAAYFQPELTYYFFSFVAFVLMVELFLRPNLLVALGAGLLLAAAQYTKASVLPMVALFSTAMVAQGLYMAVFKEKVASRLWKPLGVVAIMLLAFLLPLSPYLLESKATYGSYFYNVNSTYFIWFDSWAKPRPATRRWFMHWANPICHPTRSHHCTIICKPITRPTSWTVLGMALRTRPRTGSTPMRWSASHCCSWEDWSY